MARAIAVDGRDPFSQPFLGRLSRLMRGLCVPSFSACGILTAADCGRGQERSLVARHSLCVLAPQSPLPPRAEKRLIFGHETAFWHESGSFRRRVDPVEIADLGFRYEGTRFWSEGARSLCQNAVPWPKIGQSSACGVRVTTSFGLQMSASARGRACSLRWGKLDKGGAAWGGRRAIAREDEAWRSVGGGAEREATAKGWGCRLGAKDDCARGRSVEIASGRGAKSSACELPGTRRGRDQDE